MPQKRFTPEEIINKFRHADVLLGQGKKVAEIVKVRRTSLDFPPPLNEIGRGNIL